MSEEIVGRFRLGQFSKRVIEGEFEDSARSEAVGFSHGDFGFVIQALNGAAGTNVVFLDADIAKVFRDSESVNRALRLILDIAKSQLPPDRAA